MKWTLKDKNKYIRHIKVTLKTWFSCLAASSLQTFYDERNIGTRHTWMKYLIKIKSPYNQSFSRKIYGIHYFYTKDIHINRWYCHLFIRNSKLRWKGNGSNITILFKYTNAWFVSLYFILEVSIMDAGTFQKLLDIWKYSEADAWVNSFMNIYYLEMSARGIWHILSCKVVLYISELR